MGIVLRRYHLLVYVIHHFLKDYLRLLFVFGNCRLLFLNIIIFLLTNSAINIMTIRTLSVKQYDRIVLWWSFLLIPYGYWIIGFSWAILYILLQLCFHLLNSYIGTFIIEGQLSYLLNLHIQLPWRLFFHGTQLVI